MGRILIPVLVSGLLLLGCGRKYPLAETPERLEDLWVQIHQDLNPESQNLLVEKVEAIPGVYGLMYLPAQNKLHISVDTTVLTAEQLFQILADMGLHLKRLTPNPDADGEGV